MPYKDILYCYTDEYLVDVRETYILKYLLQAQQLADLLLDKALRPMKEGLGSYVTTASDGWLTVGLQGVMATQYPIIRLTVPPTLLQECSKLYRFYHEI